MGRLESTPRLVGAGTLLALAVSWTVATRGVAGWEVDVGRWAADLPDWTTTPLEVAMQSGTRLAAVAVAAALAVLGWRWRALAVLGAGMVAWASSRAAKEIVDRPRPTEAGLGRPVRAVVDGPGFPSSHAAISAGLAVAIVLLARPRPVVGAAVVAVAALTALARMHLGVHWVLDVVGGAALGTLAALVVVTLLVGRGRR